MYISGRLTGLITVTRRHRIYERSVRRTQNGDNFLHNGTNNTAILPKILEALSAI